MRKPKLSKSAFYILSFTWGLPLTLFGCITALVLRIAGKKPERFGWSRCFRVGSDQWGGFEAGVFFVRDTSRDEYLTSHEFGHAIQNCIYGPLMPFLVTLPSAARYWYRDAKIKRGRIPKTGYYDIWFEAQASRLGQKYEKFFLAEANNDDTKKS